jgi:hypothetical protein
VGEDRRRTDDVEEFDWFGMKTPSPAQLVFTGLVCFHDKLYVSISELPIKTDIGDIPNLPSLMRF